VVDVHFWLFLCMHMAGRSSTSPGEYLEYRIFFKERRCKNLLASLPKEKRENRMVLGSVVV
jgi:hypothetical protein